MLFQHPMPTFEKLQSYYADYATSKEVCVALSGGSQNDRLRRWYHRLTGDVDPRDFVAAQPGSRMLDFGCGIAPYLTYFRSRGAIISGAEIAPSIAQAYQAARFDVAVIESMERIPFPDGEFDIAYLMQVFEHVARPHQLMRELCRVLKPSGNLYLAMPNARSVWRRMLSDHWVAGWFAPFHLFVYSLAGIETLARAHGFEVANWWSSTPESWLRLHLKAWLFRDDNRLDSSSSTWLDLPAFRIPLLLLLRLAEVFIRERDCLVVKLRKAG